MAAIVLYGEHRRVVRWGCPLLATVLFCLCVDTIAKYLYYAFIVDFTLEMLDLIHRLYVADESLLALDFMVKTKLFYSQIVIQILIGTAVPLALLASVQFVHWSAAARKAIYSIAGVLIMIGIFAMRWNVVIGGQLFSKSFLGYTTYKLDFATKEGMLPALVFLIMPFLILWGLVKILPPWEPDATDAGALRHGTSTGA